MSESVDVGGLVVVPWGLDEVRGTIVEIYGSARARRVVVELTPELSGYVVDEPTTVVWPAEAVRRAPMAV